MRFLYLLVLLVYPLLVDSQSLHLQKRGGSFLFSAVGGLSSKREGKADLDQMADNMSLSYALRLARTGFVHPHVSLGIGTGIDGDLGFNQISVPVFADARFFLKKQYNYISFYDSSNSFFIYSNYGKFLKIGNNSYKGDFFEIGVGHSFASIGYNYRNMSTGEQSVKVHSFVLNFITYF
ncbi:MAG: hypothetical protein QM660_11670 [Dysgonomonas sp.]